MNYNNRIIIRNLYRSKLRLCNQLGYQYGDWNNHIVRKKINMNKVHRLVSRLLGGNYIMNNIRYKYKIHKYETNKKIIDDRINDGFETLKELNELAYFYKK